MKQNLILMVVSTLIILIGVEVGLQLLWTNPYAGSGTDKVLRIRVHHANVAQEFDRSAIDPDDSKVVYRTSARGYIEPTQQFADPDYTMVFLGGSTTECIAVDEQQRFPVLVSTLLGQRGSKVNSLNVARSGGTLHDSINILFNHVAQEQPDFAIVMHVTNDVGILKGAGNYNSRMGHSVTAGDIGKYLLQLASSKLAFAGLVREAVVNTPFSRIDDTQYTQRVVKDVGPFKARLEIFIGTSRALGIEPILMTQPLAGNIRNALTPEWLDPNAQAIFNETIREVGRANDTSVIDLERFIAGRVKDPQELNQIFYDGMHVTDYGSSLYAEHIAERMAEVIANRR